MRDRAIPRPAADTLRGAWHSGSVKRRLALGGMIVAAAAVLVYGSEHEVELAQTTTPVSATVVVEHDADLRMVCRSEAIDVCWPALVHERTGWLRVDGEHPWQVELPGRVGRWRKGSVRLEADASGERFAVKAGRGPWRAVFAGPDGLGFVYGRVPADVDGEIDWAAVPDFHEAAPRLFERARHDQRLALLKEVEHRGGQRDLVRFMVEVAGVRPRGTYEQRVNDGAWGEVYRSLPPRAQKKIQRRLKRAFMKHSLGHKRLKRTLRYLDLQDPAVLARIDRLLSRAPQRFGHRRRAESIMLRALLAHDSMAAAAHACRMAQQYEPAELAMGGNNAGAHHREAILLALATGWTHCPIAREALGQARASETGWSGFSSLGAEAGEQLVEQLRSADPRLDLWADPHREVSDAEMGLLLQAAADRVPRRCGGR